MTDPASPGPALVAFKDLVIDACDAPALARFWATATGLTAEPRAVGDPVLLRDDAAEGERDDHRAIWVVPVPEPVTVKQRVHVDVHTSDVDALLEAGATQVEDRGWHVLRDPEGGELCAFVRDDDRASGYRVYEVVVDCARPEDEARWWADRFGVEPGHDPEHGWWWLTAPGMPFDSMVFVPVPEQKTVKNRVHWDVWCGHTLDLDRTVSEILEVGGTLLAPAAPDEDRPWVVMASPEGHEFCVFPRPA